MGIFDRLVSTARLEPTVLSSPWSTGELEAGVVMAEALGFPIDVLPLSRSKAIQVPAVARARNLLVSTIAPLPLRVLDNAGALEQQPAWLSDSQHSIETPYDRMAWTVDDLFFHGLSLWAIARDAVGAIIDGVHVPFAQWQIKDERVLVKLTAQSGFEPVSASEVILFVHPSHGLLVDAEDSIKAARAIEQAYVSRARNPIPLTVIRHVNGSTGTDELEQDEIDALLTQWKTARQSPDGALGYLPPTLQMDTPGTDATDMLQDARNAARIDIANHANLPVTLIDGGVAQESMTYRNGQSEVSRYFVEALPYWADAIAHRLSRGDVVPDGQRIRFDLATFDTPAPPSTGVPTDD